MALLAVQHTVGDFCNDPGHSRERAVEQSVTAGEVARASDTRRSRGNQHRPSGDDTSAAVVHIVEDVLPLIRVRVGVRRGRPATAVTLAPSGEALPFAERDGVTWTTVPRVAGHQAVVFV